MTNNYSSIIKEISLANKHGLNYLPVGMCRGDKETTNGLRATQETLDKLESYGFVVRSTDEEGIYNITWRECIF